MVKNLLNKIRNIFSKDDIVTRINTQAYETTSDQMACGYCGDVC